MTIEAGGMEHYQLRLLKGRRPAFDEVPDAFMRRAHGVDYVGIRGLKGGDLFFTRQGWAIAESLLPHQWYENERFWRIGRALPGATGAVYRVPVPHPARGSVGIVVKFCRFGQSVGITVVGDGTRFPWPEELVASAEFLGPFEEFGAISRLRRCARRPPIIRTKCPLAIYCPSTNYSRWQLGREDYRFGCQARVLAADQASVPEARRLAYDPERIYVLLYQWIEGIDAEAAARQGLIDGDTMVALGQNAAEALVAHGFAVLDHKPRHVILRPRENGPMLARGGATVYGLIDYELLVPIPSLTASPKVGSGFMPRQHGAARDPGEG